MIDIVLKVGKELSFAKAELQILKRNDLFRFDNICIMVIDSTLNLYLKNKVTLKVRGSCHLCYKGRDDLFRPYQGEC